MHICVLKFILTDKPWGKYAIIPFTSYKGFNNKLNIIFNIFMCIHTRTITYLFKLYDYICMHLPQTFLH